MIRLDIDSGKLVRSWMLDQEQESPYHIFNDIALTASGDAFVTTTLLGGIYKITPGNEAMTLVHQLAPGSKSAYGVENDWLTSD